MRHSDHTIQSSFDADAEPLSNGVASDLWAKAACAEVIQEQRKRTITNDDLSPPPEDNRSTDTTESEHSQVKAVHDRVQDLAKLSILDAQLLKSFEKNMRLFEGRTASIAKHYADSGISPVDAQVLARQEIIGTYKEIAQLLESTSNKPLSRQRRIEIAQQILSQAATPTSIDQGCHSTCNVTTVEVRTYTRNPSIAARLVSEIARTGQYTSTEGVTVRLSPQSLKADPEATMHPPTPGSRSFASQLFQVAAVNLWYAKHEPYLRYEQHPPQYKDDSGERLVNYVGEQPLWNPGNTPELSCYQIADIGLQITGRYDKGWILTTTKKQPSNQDALTTISSAEQLATEIKSAASAGKFPLVVEVCTNNETFGGSSYQKNRQGSDLHVVTIYGYKDGPRPLIFIDNQWGPSADHLTTSTALTVDQLFRAMQCDSK